MSDRDVEHLLAAPGDLSGIDYPLGFYRQMSPLHLDYVCTLNGMQSPDLDVGFTYCELGCGSGATLAILADADRRGRFYGIDYAESHIADARRLAQDGGVDNVEFILADLLDYDPEELPAFDFITMHGLWTWVPTEVRQAILRFAERKLKPSGLLYVSYNALPGWSGSVPMRRYFLERANRLPGDLHDKIPTIVGELEELLENDALYFKEHALARRVLKSLSSASAGYLAHEYLAGAWQPDYFSGVCRDMASVGLRYVGHAMVLENLIELSTPRNFVGVLKAIDDVEHREFVRDYVVNRMFRGDVYQRPGESARRTRGGLGSTLLGLVPATCDVTSELRIWGGKLDLKGPLFERLKELLAFDVLTLDEIRADAEMSKFPDGMLVQAVLALTASGQLAPFASKAPRPPDVSTGRVRITSQLNRTLLATRTDDEIPLACPAAGTGLHFEALDALLLDAVSREDPVAWLRTAMERRGMKMSRGGEALRTEDETLEAIRASVAEFRRERLPKLAWLGYVAPHD